MDKFRLMTELISGENALDYLHKYNNANILIVCDSFLEQNGTLDNITAKFGEGNKVVSFTGVVPDPTLGVIAKVLAIAKELEPDIIIGLGGGSAIDTVKAVIYFAMGKNVLAKKPISIAIPTTSGTGSEMTAVSIVTDESESTKVSLIDDIMRSDVAILDPVLTLTVPAVITANTGFDVIAHALEAYVSDNATAFTDALAVKAFEMAIKALPRCYENGSDIEARNEMHIASNLAGVAFDCSGLGLVHGLAHQLGGVYHIPHGAACAMSIPHAILYNCREEKAAKKYADLAQKVGLVPVGLRPTQGTAALVALLETMMEKMDMVKWVRDIKNPPSQEAYEAELAGMAEHVLIDRCLAGNPRSVTKDNIIALYKEMY